MKQISRTLFSFLFPLEHFPQYINYKATKENYCYTKVELVG